MKLNICLTILTIQDLSVGELVATPPPPLSGEEVMTTRGGPTTNSSFFAVATNFQTIFIRSGRISGDFSEEQTLEKISYHK